MQSQSLPATAQSPAASVVPTPVDATRAGSSLPGGLVHLSAVDATIQQDIRYASTGNFTGSKLPGYQAAECIVTRPTALALAQVQARLKPQGLSLKVYDCYRPRRAVLAMMTWVKSSSGTSKHYHPNVSRDELVAKGYVADKSGHSRGDTVDLTIVQIGSAPLPPADSTSPPGPCNSPSRERGADNSVDMGTSFDCFDPKSFTRSPRLTDEQRRWRSILLQGMEQQGFRNYAKEWWHFTYGSGSGPTFDFPIQSR